MFYVHGGRVTFSAWQCNCVLHDNNKAANWQARIVLANKLFNKCKEARASATQHSVERKNNNISSKCSTLNGALT